MPELTIDMPLSPPPPAQAKFVAEPRPKLVAAGTHREDGTLTGLAVAATGKEFVAVSSDGMLSLWSEQDGHWLRSLWKELPAKCAGLACGFSADEELVAIGLGARAGEASPSVSGGVIIVDRARFDIEYAEIEAFGDVGVGIGGGRQRERKKERKKARSKEERKKERKKEKRKEKISLPSSHPPQVTAVAFATSGASFAAGCADGCIAVYSCSGRGSPLLSRLCILHTAHGQSIVSLDFSNGGEFLQSTCSGPQLHHWDLRRSTSERADGSTGGKLVTASKPVAQASWQTWTAPVGWPVQGLWAVRPARRRPFRLETDIDAGFTVAGSRLGTLSVFSAPALVRPEEEAQELVAHSSRVVGVRLAKSGSRVVSLGDGRYGGVAVWDLLHGDAAAAARGVGGVGAARHGGTSAFATTECAKVHEYL